MDLFRKKESGVSIVSKISWNKVSFRILQAVRMPCVCCDKQTMFQLSLSALSSSLALLIALTLIFYIFIFYTLLSLIMKLDSLQNSTLQFEGQIFQLDKLKVKFFNSTIWRSNSSNSTNWRSKF